MRDVHTHTHFAKRAGSAAAAVTECNVNKKRENPKPVGALRRSCGCAVRKRTPCAKSMKARVYAR